MRFFLINIVIFLMIIAGVVSLQIFLSKKQNKWLGLIIPIICFLFSTIGVLGIATYSVIEQTVSESGEIIRNAVNVVNSAPLPSTIFTVICIFILYNIPTAILMAIYFACREKLKKHNEIEKMNIQDLE